MWSYPVSLQVIFIVVLPPFCSSHKDLLLCIAYNVDSQKCVVYASAALCENGRSCVYAWEAAPVANHALRQLSPSYRSGPGVCSRGGRVHRQAVAFSNFQRHLQGAILAFRNLKQVMIRSNIA